MDEGKGSPEQGAGESAESLYPLAPRSSLDGDILELDLEPISYLAAIEQGWDLEKLDSVELEYRCFLQLVRDRPDIAIVPGRDCDLYWHAHILALEIYLEHCQTLFRGPLLHYPFSGRLGPEDAAFQVERFQKSRQILAELVTRVRRARNIDVNGEAK